MPMLAVTVTRVSLVGAELERVLERLEQALGDELGGPPSSESSSAITTNSSPPRRPSASALAHDALEARGDRLQQLVADAVAERVVDRS